MKFKISSSGVSIVQIVHLAYKINNVIIHIYILNIVINI